MKIAKNLSFRRGAEGARGLIKVFELSHYIFRLSHKKNLGENKALEISVEARQGARNCF